MGSVSRRATFARHARKPALNVTALPAYATSDNSTDCCPRFSSDCWGGRGHYLRDKTFIHATTRSVMHVPLNMGSVLRRVLGKMEPLGAIDPDKTIVLSRDRAAWAADHYFSTTGPIEGKGKSSRAEQSEHWG